MPNYKLRIVRGDHEFEAEGDKAFVQQMAQRFGGEPSAPASPPKSKTGTSADAAADDIKLVKTGKQVSVREFVQKLGLKKHTDFVLAFGYYIEHNLGKSSFSPADINNLYYEAKLEPSNTSQACIQNIKRSLMMEDKNVQKGGRKAYTLTHSGETFVTKKLQSAP